MEQLGWTLTALPAAPTAEVLLARRVQVVVVDVRVLGPRWEDWLTRHPARVPNLGVLVCSTPSSLRQRVRGLNAGADDWITKPCDVEEVAARVLAVARAHRRASEPGPLVRRKSGRLELRPTRYDAFVDGRAARLTRREFAVLLCLASEEDMVLDRERIYREVWGHAMPVGDRALDTVVRKIRGKLLAIEPEERYIQTHRGIGYRFAVQRGRRPSR